MEITTLLRQPLPLLSQHHRTPNRQPLSHCLNTHRFRSKILLDHPKPHLSSFILHTNLDPLLNLFPNQQALSSVVQPLLVVRLNSSTTPHLNILQLHSAVIRQVFIEHQLSQLFLSRTKILHHPNTLETTQIAREAISDIPPLNQLTSGPSHQPPKLANQANSAVSLAILAHSKTIWTVNLIVLSKYRF